MKKNIWTERLIAIVDTIGISICILCTYVVIQSFVTMYNTITDPINGVFDNTPKIKIPIEPTMVQFSEDIPIEVTREDKKAILAERKKLFYEIEVISKVLYREARGMDDPAHIAAVAWCVLNRVDNPRFGDMILDVLWAPGQFCWVEDTPLINKCNYFAEDVVTRWLLEKYGYTDVGRVLPHEYLYFYCGSDKLNYFTTTWNGEETWDWSLPSPYN